MINSLDSEKAFEKIQQAFIVKVMKSLGIHGSYLKLVKPVYHKPIANINLKQRNSSYFHYSLEQDSSTETYRETLEHSAVNGMLPTNPLHLRAQVTPWQRRQKEYKTETIGVTRQMCSMSAEQISYKLTETETAITGPARVYTCWCLSNQCFCGISAYVNVLVFDSSVYSWVFFLLFVGLAKL